MLSRFSVPVGHLLFYGIRLNVIRHEPEKAPASRPAGVFADKLW